MYFGNFITKTFTALIVGTPLVTAISAIEKDQMLSSLHFAEVDRPIELAQNILDMSTATFD